MPTNITTYAAPTNHSYRAATGMLTLIAVVLGGLAFYLTLAIAIYPQHDEGFAIVERGPYIHAYDPIALAELGLPPNSSSVTALPAKPEVRAISAYADRLTLIAAGVPVKTVPLAEPLADLQQLKNLLNDADWIQEEHPGTYLLKAALITYSEKPLIIGAPYVREVHMLDVPSVFIGVKGGTLEFKDVVVSAVDAGSAGSGEYQPFVMATENAKMSMTNSRFANLGWDWNASYGVSWEHGSTGDVAGTVFEDSFIGAYTSRAERLSFVDCTFRNNHLYGLDPHTYSRNLVIDHVTAEGNGAHGIIFSDHVTDSVVKRSASFGNGENGIMMDQSSTNNIIVDNTVYRNSGDGLVTASSEDNKFARNTVFENRVGVRIDEADASRTAASNNTIARNNKAAENIELDATNVVQKNGGQWDTEVVLYIWSAAIVCFVLFSLLYLLAVARKRKSRRPNLVLI